MDSSLARHATVSLLFLAVVCFFGYAPHALAANDEHNCGDFAGSARIPTSYSCFYPNFIGEPGTPSRRFCMLGAPCQSDRKCEDGEPLAKGYCSRAHTCKTTQVHQCSRMPVIEDTPSMRDGYVPAARYQREPPEEDNTPMGRAVRTGQPQSYTDPVTGARITVTPLPSTPSRSSSWLSRIFGW